MIVRTIVTVAFVMALVAALFTTPSTTSTAYGVYYVAAPHYSG